MPKSKLRKKVQKAHAHQQEAFLVGLFWIVVFYVTQTSYPIPGIGAWNMVIGFSFIGFGFTLATKWR
ncbi:MAG: hypothetical protein EBY75_08755 [Actinobacteria bacterium]|nr:hypothetical protein [Actinomycetota bacterium]